MESPVRNSLWWVLRADSDEARRARGRLGVGLALALLVSGLLTAVGLAMVVFVSSLAVVMFVAGMGLFRAVRRNRVRLKQSACAAVTAGYRTSSRESRRAAEERRSAISPPWSTRGTRGPSCASAGSTSSARLSG